MLKFLSVYFLLVSTVCAFAGFSGDGFGSSGFFQYVQIAAPSTGLKTPVLASIALPTSGTTTPEFAPLVGSSGTAVAATAATRAVPIPVAGKISGLYASLGVIQTGASVVDVINGSAGTLGCAYTAATAPFSCNDSTHSDSVNAGDIMQWKWTLASGTWAQTVANPTSFIFQASSGQQGFMLAGPTNSNLTGATTSIFMGFGSDFLATGTTDIRVSSIMPTAGQITGLYAIPNTSENTVPHVFTVFHNGSSTSLACTAQASTAAGCCANLTGTGTVGAPGTTATCSSISAITIAAGDTLSVNITCASGTCATISPGISVIWAPTTTGQAVITAQALPGVASPFWGLMDNIPSATQANVVQIAPQIGASTLTFSNLIACVATNPGGAASRTFTSQSGSAPNVTPTNVSGGTVAIVNVANGACPGANSATLLGGTQDNTHTWTAASGNSLDTDQTDAVGPAGGVQVHKIGYVAVISP